VLHPHAQAKQGKRRVARAPGEIPIKPIGKGRKGYRSSLSDASDHDGTGGREHLEDEIGHATQLMEVTYEDKLPVSKVLESSNLV
jgi:hypothetical protein